MRPSIFWLAAPLAALSLTSCVALPVFAADSYSLHVKISKVEHGRALDFSVPWDVERGSSPFDFISDSDDRPEVERLRAAWSMLGQLPEGKSVVISSSHGRTRAWRRGGNLVLMPLDDGNDQKVRVRVPGPIVEAVLRHDGRLRSDDLADLLQRHGEISLVEVQGEGGRVEVWIDRSNSPD